MPLFCSAASPTLFPLLRLGDARFRLCSCLSLGRAIIEIGSSQIPKNLPLFRRLAFTPRFWYFRRFYVLLLASWLLLMLLLLLRWWWSCANFFLFPLARRNGRDEETTFFSQRALLRRIKMPTLFTFRTQIGIFPGGGCTRITHAFTDRIANGFDHLLHLTGPPKFNPK